MHVIGVADSPSGSSGPVLRTSVVVDNSDTLARKVIYTTNSIESFNNQLRKATRNRVQFTNDDSALKTLWLMICNIEDKRAIKRAKQGKRASATASRLVEGARVSGWKQAINQMAVAFPDRFDKYL